MSDDTTKSYFAVIPANVRYDRDLPANAKLLYGEITALCNENGYCWATNGYFANLYGVSKVSISKWVKALADKGYIKAEIRGKDGSKDVERYLTLVNDPINKSLIPPLTKVNAPLKEKLKDNNTYNITFNKSKKERPSNSYDEILSSIPDDSLRDLYCEYIKMRKLIKSPLTDRALKMLIKKVQDLEPADTERQKQLLETAILNNWKSVYPLKDNISKRGNENGTNRTDDEYSAIGWG